MMEVRHTQTRIIRFVSRHTWETSEDFKHLRHLWQIIDPGDPVMMVEINKVTGTHTDLGLFDRDHAERMISMDMAAFYMKEIDLPKPETVTHSEWVDKVLADASKSAISLPRSTPDGYRDALHYAVNSEYVDPVTYELLPKGLQVTLVGGEKIWSQLNNLTVSELTEHVLREVEKGLGGMSKLSHPNYVATLKRCIQLKLVTDSLIDPKITQDGNQALSEGFDKWQKKRKLDSDEFNSKSTTINYHGPVTNSPLVQDSSFRDLNNLSPSKKNEPQQVHPSKNPIKKTDHSIWDKIKYVSVIVGGTSALIATIWAIAKFIFHW